MCVHCEIIYGKEKESDEHYRKCKKSAQIENNMQTKMHDKRANNNGPDKSYSRQQNLSTRACRLVDTYKYNNNNIKLFTAVLLLCDCVNDKKQTERNRKHKRKPKLVAAWFDVWKVNDEMLICNTQKPNEGKHHPLRMIKPNEMLFSHPFSFHSSFSVVALW